MRDIIIEEIILQKKDSGNRKYMSSRKSEKQSSNNQVGRALSWPMWGEGPSALAFGSWFSIKRDIHYLIASLWLTQVQISHRTLIIQEEHRQRKAACSEPTNKVS